MTDPEAVAGKAVEPWTPGPWRYESRGTVGKTGKAVEREDVLRALLRNRTHLRNRLRLSGDEHTVSAEPFVVIETDGRSHEMPWGEWLALVTDGLRRYERAASQALGTMRWAEANVPKTNLRSDIILLADALGEPWERTA